MAGTGTGRVNFYKHFIGDYARDTQHLTMVEHGAYRLMLDGYYATGKPLPDDSARLYRMLGAMDRAEQAAVETILAEFWRQTPDGWVNKRATKEIERANERAETNARIAQERETKRATNRSPTFRSQTRASASSAEPEPEPEPEPDTRTSEEDNANALLSAQSRRRAPESSLRGIQ